LKLTKALATEKSASQTSKQKHPDIKLQLAGKNLATMISFKVTKKMVST